MRIALGLEYDGCHYHGWQSQPNLCTVQNTLEKALTKVANTQVHVQCAGRTDTGVHATNQVVHFDCEVERSLRAWVYGVNTHLPKDVSVKWSKAVDEKFHARFSALSRKYRYVIFNHPIRSALFRSNVTWHYRQLDANLMHQASQFLIGEHDFSSFRSVECQSKTPYRNVLSVEVTKNNDLIYIDIEANAFLHHMVRNIAGVLIAVGAGKKETHWVKELLEAKNRAQAAETAPPYGLYLMHVSYPDVYKLPNSCVEPLFQNRCQ